MAHIHDINPENIDFVGIADELAKELLPRRQIPAKLIDIMLVNSHTNHIILAHIVQKIADMAVSKQVMRPVFGMVHGPIIDERMILPQLLKSADIVEDADEPGQIHIILRQIQTQSNLFTQPAHPQRMSILQPDAFFLLVKALDVPRKL